MTKEIQSPNDEGEIVMLFVIQASLFDILSSFGFRHSGFLTELRHSSFDA